MNTETNNCVRKRNQSSQAADHVVVNYLPVERVHPPRTISHEEAQCGVVVLEDTANHGVVNYHKVQLEERAARKRRRAPHRWLRSR